jgi:hypothetical protein
MAVQITQVPQILSIVLFDKDGTTKLFSEGEMVLDPGLLLPLFPEVGQDAEFVVGSITHQAQILQKRHTYFIAGNAVTSKLMIVARKKDNAPVMP